MKKIYTLIAAVLTTVTLSAQMYDLEIELVTPASGSTVAGTYLTNVDFTLTNNGPTTIPIGDTLWFGYSIETDFYSFTGVVNGASGIILSTPFPSGASATAANLGGLNIPLGNITANSQVCVWCYGVNGAVSLTSDPNDSDNLNNFDCFTATPAANVGVTEIEIATSVYPNPATDVLNIVSSEEIANVSIISLDGKVALTATATTVSVSDLTPGMYVYEVTTTSGTVTRNTFMKK